MSLAIGTLVVSQSGRDTDTVMAVIGVSDTHLILANGRKRRIEKPKHKKLKHVKVLDLTLTAEETELLTEGQMTNKMLYNGIRQSLMK